jgi:hypothetical protein
MINGNGRTLIQHVTAIDYTSCLPVERPDRMTGPCRAIDGRCGMDEATREKRLKIALVSVGVIFFTIYPLGVVWPSGWQWHAGHGQYYLQMICAIYAVLGAYLIAAVRDPSRHRSLISFAIWSSIVHAGVMAVQALYDEHEMGHMIGDVPALLVVAAVLWWLSPERMVRAGNA